MLEQNEGGMMIPMLANGAIKLMHLRQVIICV
jgi:hypothetical protein